jgi:hypothetical protein
MRTDPRAACANAEERLFWAWLHDIIAHPLMALFGWASWTLQFHDWTSHRAWPRKRQDRIDMVMVWSDELGQWIVMENRGRQWTARNDVRSFTFLADDLAEAMDIAESEWIAQRKFVESKGL